MGRFVLMGSGETAPTMVRLHRRLMSERRPGPAVLLDTPFGFQVNADDLVDKTVTYFEDSVGEKVEVASWRRSDLPVLGREQALALLQRAGWAFAGPGSPSYALRQWADTPMPDALHDVAARGGTLCLGSAAAVVGGTHAIPVYEIYKAGIEPHWLEGLDLLGRLTGLSAAVVPHYDNNEGGHYDTRFCYLGAERLERLEGDLPDGTGILGVDEHTAIVIDLETRTAEITGAGTVTARSGGRSTALASGTTIALDELDGLLRGRDGTSAGTAAVPVTSDDTPVDAAAGVSESLRSVADEARSRFDDAVGARDVDRAVEAVLDLEQALQDWQADTQQGDDAYARRTLRAMVVELGQAARVGVRDPREAVAPFVELALRLRAQAREAKDFAASDLVRDALIEAGIAVRDTADGVTWEIVESP